MQNISSVHPSAPAEHELIERARALVPALRQRAAASAQARRIPDETVRDFHEAGFFRILQPVDHGGYGLSPLTLSHVVTELGRGDMSAGWVAFVLGLHPYLVALMGDAACETVWGARDHALVATSVSPFGTLRKAQGGYVAQGTWRFSSGVEHADWVAVGGNVALPDGGADFRIALVPTTRISIDLDSWKTFGLAGTGSKDFTIAEAFVPEHLSYSLSDAGRMRGQAALPPSYRYPFWTTFNALVASAVVGGAKGAVDEACEQMKMRTSSMGGQAAVDDPFARSRVARASVLVRGAETRLTAMFGEMRAHIAAGSDIPVADRMHYIAECTQCGRDSEEAALAVYKATGARGLALANPMQEILRNVLAGANHVAMNLDGKMDELGGQLLGRAPARVMC